MDGTVVDVGKGEPVLLLHGYPQSAACWRHQIPALAENHRVIAADWPGFGHADPPVRLPTYDNEVEHIGRLADSFGLERFNLIAHDYGGFLGLGYVMRNPDRVTRLGLLNTRAHNVFRPWFYRFSRGQTWAAKHAPALLGRLPLRRIHHVALGSYRRLGCFDNVLEDEYLGWMDTARGRRTFVEFFANYHLAAVPELAAGLGRIGCPTAVIWGDRDRYIPFATARELADLIPAATLTRLGGGDHYIMEERPGEVTDALLQLLARAPVSAESD
ncbi:alpha/beta fold hydrolase [Mycolicibacterium gadium]|uniref:Alpha/beta hydrolase n=1 Tax=Mycolicibacterium gadium TaxID=1794 RepID=A0ABT6GL67_MYCGU|nr:alpha/beta hydrolase [Mycolicibacterium gadium]MDG5482150.1 alpha/beta hydrolase [Mycolicibacterium gadium]